MKTARCLALVAMIALLLFGTTPADAAIDFTWSFDDPQPAVGTPTTVFNMPATLVVDLESDSFTLTGATILGGEFGPEYSLSTDWLGEFLLQAVEPGDNLHFNFGTFTPAAPDFTVAPEEYALSLAIIKGTNVQGEALEVNASNLFTARVVVDGAVPEPATLLLLGSGLAGVAVWRRRRT